MNCSKKMKRKIHNFVIKALTALNVFSLIYWICLVLYANGWVTDTEDYERLEKEGEYYDEM